VSNSSTKLDWARLRSDEAVGGLVLALLTGASLLPVLLVPIPAMVDYPDHLARMYILSSTGTAQANPFYRVTWELYPNLAMDLLIPQIAGLVSVAHATRIFLFISQILIITGAVAIELVQKGRMRLALPAALMCLYSLPFTWGFVNFEFGLGVALWGIAASLMVVERPWPVRFGVNSIFVVALFAAHFFALGIYGATLGFYELWRAWERKGGVREPALRFLLLAAPAAVVLVAMAFSGGAVGYVGTNWLFDIKPLWPFRIMNGYSMTVSALTASALIGWLYVAARHRVLTLKAAGPWMTIGFALLYLVMPGKLFGTSFVDLRVIVAAALILPAFMSVSLPSWRWRLATVGCVSFVITANLAVVFSVWLSYRADYAAMIASFGNIEKGSLLLVAHSGAGDDPPLGNLTEYPMYHAATLAVHYADAFVPDLFTAAGKQPVRARPDLQRLDIPDVGPVPIAILAAIAAGKTPAGTPAFIRSWDRDFDYLYVLGPHRDNPMPALLQEVDSARRFVLYKIRRPARSAPAAQ
jgi:hypothetical protein